MAGKKVAANGSTVPWVTRLDVDDAWNSRRATLQFLRHLQVVGTDGLCDAERIRCAYPGANEINRWTEAATLICFVHCQKSSCRMAAMGHSRHIERALATSALTP